MKKVKLTFPPTLFHSPENPPDMVCSFGSRETDGCNGDEEEPLSICGEDSEGLVYRQQGDKVRCNVNGRWESVCDKTIVDEPICVAHVCSEDIITKGKKIIGSANNSTVEDMIMTKEEVLANHCTSLRAVDRKNFEEGKASNFSPHY